MPEHALRERLPAVDRERLAGDVARRVGEQEERAATTSSSVAKRRSGMSAEHLARGSPAVGNSRSAAAACRPGRARALTRMPSGAHSTASVRARLWTPPSRRPSAPSRVAGPRVGRDHVQDRPPSRPRAAASDRGRAVERPVEDDVDDRPPAVGRQVDGSARKLPAALLMRMPADRAPRLLLTQASTARDRARRPARRARRRRASGTAPPPPRSARRGARTRPRGRRLGQGQRERPAHPRAAARDQHGASVKRGHARPPRRRRGLRGSARARPRRTPRWPMRRRPAHR